MSPNDSATSTGGYWARTRRLGFALPRCADCGRFHFYPRPACPFCGSERIAPAAASGRATVYTYSVVHRPPSPAFAADVPYIVAIVQMEEGPHLMTRLDGIDGDHVAIGMAVEVDLAGDYEVPRFRPVRGKESS